MQRSAATCITVGILLLAWFSAMSASASSRPERQSDTVANIERLITQIQTEQSPRIRWDLAQQLSDLVRRADPADINTDVIDHIAGLLSDRADFVRLWAAVALGNIGPPARRAIPALEKALSELPVLYSGAVMQPALDSSGAIVPALRKIRGEPPE